MAATKKSDFGRLFQAKKTRQPDGPLSMSDDFPDPLTPPGSNLQSYDWFPLFHKKLRRSNFWRSSTDQVCRISVDFWAECYEQIPVASLPDDDSFLSDMAGFGRRNLKPWLALKPLVMAPWTLCKDGRWYHPVLAAIANETLARRSKWAERKAAQRAAMSHETSANVHPLVPRDMA